MILSRVFSKIPKPILFGSGAIAIFIWFWLVQQNNISSLEGKIADLSAKIAQTSSIDERLKLEKDILGFEKDKTIIQNGAYTNLVQALGGLVLSITAWVGYQNFKVGEKNLKISEDKQVTERFSKSIEHLGSEKIDIRLGGIYALEQIAIDSTKYHWTIMEILSAFIREKCPLDNMVRAADNAEQTSSEEQFDRQTRVSIDIQAAMTVLGRRNVERDPENKIIDLRNVNLPSIEIAEANLRIADLSGADLSYANLRRANLIGANLIGSDLSYANLIEANLSGAKLRRANLIGTNLIGADLNYANLIEADLSYANLSYANLIEADLSGANLRKTNLRKADLSKTNLSKTNLNYANLSKTNLNYANLSGADLSGADLIEANLNYANLIDIKVQGTIFSHNLDLPDFMKRDLAERGAIFQ